MKLRKLLVLLLLLGAAFVLSACGAAGQDGKDGQQGPKGETGAPGQNGSNGTNGTNGEDGTDGTNGVGIEFSFTKDGIAWNYEGADEKTIGVRYEDIFQAIADYKVKDKVVAFGFDYYVGTEVAELAADADVKVFDKTLKVGTTAFAKLSDAFAAAKVESAKTDYAGVKIYLGKGVYTEYVTLDTAKVSIIGPNVNINPNTQERNEEATIAGSIKVNANDFTINGVEFSGIGQNVTDAGVVSETGTATEFGNTNLNIVGNNVKILNCTTSSTNVKQYMLNFGNVEGLEIGNCRIYPKHSGYDLRPIRGVSGTQKDVNIHDNYILNDCAAGAVCDAIRLNNIAGILSVTNNVCDWSSNNWGWFFGSSSNKCTKIDIIGNKMECTDSAAYGSGITVRNIGGVSADCVISIKYNHFGNISGTNLQLRVGSTAIASTSTLKIELQNLAYQNANTYIDADAALVTYMTVSKCYFQEDMASHVKPNTLTCTDRIYDITKLDLKPAA